MDIKIASNMYLMPDNTAWHDDHFKFEVGQYNNWLDALLSDDKTSLALVIFVSEIFKHSDYLNQVQSDFDSVKEKFSLIEHSLSKYPKRPLILCTYIPYSDSNISNARLADVWFQISQMLNEYIRSLTEQYKNLHFIDLNRSFSFVGINQCLSLRNQYLLQCPLSFKGIEVLRQSIHEVSTRLVNPAKKVLALDCDNTLWGGVIGEDGLRNLVLGQDGKGKAFQDFQRAALLLKQQGYLLCILSKNNEEDVWQVFEKHHDMILKKSDIVGWRINWQSKAVNIAELAAELNVGIDSVIFWDDNLLEQEEMKTIQPSVTTVDVPQSIFEWPKSLISHPDLNKFVITDDDKLRTQMYGARKNFEIEQKTITNRSDFLNSLNMVPTFLDVDDSTIGRAEQLCSKTNQFNMRTVRHQASDLLQFIDSNNYDLYLVRLSDRFGDHGIVGLFIVEFDKIEKICFIDTFLMSCRILGRELETLCLEHIFNAAKKRGIIWCLAEYQPTQKNKGFASFFSDHGFSPYSKDLTNIAIETFFNKHKSDGGELFLYDIRRLEQ